MIISGRVFSNFREFIERRIILGKQFAKMNNSLKIKNMSYVVTKEKEI
jgi:hypothetical protein